MKSNKVKYTGSYISIMLKMSKRSAIETYVNRMIMN